MPNAGGGQKQIMIWIERWMTLHALIMLLGCSLTILTKNINLIAISAAISFVALFVWNSIRSRNLTFLTEPANLVTNVRLLTLILVLLYLPALSDFWIGCLSLGVLFLDALDGYLARRFQTTSTFGAYLDMETDAFFVLSLTIILFYQEKVGYWILSVGLLRYIYFLILLFFKPKKKKESRDYFAQVIAVILMGSLAGSFFLPGSIYLPALVMASILVFWSFGKSFFIQIKN